MLRITEIRLPLDHGPEALKSAVLKALRIAPTALKRFSVFKRGHDARKKSAIVYVYTVDAEVADEAAVLKKLERDPHVQRTPDMEYKFVARAPEDLKARPVVIGAGPCGLFAGLILAQMGFRPIILERGKVVRERTKDTWGLWRRSVLNPESNVQFGEGGAGTFSDGKLYSQIKDPRHLGRKVLTEFVKAGAPEEILTEAKPHIGTFRLVTMVESLRATIEGLGGEYRFRASRRPISTSTMRAARARRRAGERRAHRGRARRARRRPQRARHVRDAARARRRHGGQAVLHRLAHRASAVADRPRPLRRAASKELGAADYKLVHHASNGRSVYSFCMCPGGTVVAATSEEGRVVTNGMSQYSRNERNANAGIVVGITPEDYPGGMRWPASSSSASGKRARSKPAAAPTRRRASASAIFWPDAPRPNSASVVPSYRPGVHLTDLSDCLPDYAIAAIREALPAFGRQIQGFAMDDAVLTGVETRTSSPIRIRRGEDFQSLNTTGLYPAGEGAGFAGGILSAAWTASRSPKPWRATWADQTTTATSAGPPG